jgi:hypothetical protein
LTGALIFEGSLLSGPKSGALVLAVLAARNLRQPLQIRPVGGKKAVRDLTGLFSAFHREIVTGQKCRSNQNLKIFIKSTKSASLVK